MNSVHASSHTNLQFYTWILLYVISGMNSYVGPLAFSQGQPLLHMNSAYVISCMISCIGPLYILTGPASAAAHLIFSEELQVALGDPYPALDGNQGKHGSYRIQSNSGRVAKSTPYLEYKCEHQAKWRILNAQIAMPVDPSCVSWISAFHFRMCLSLDELWFFQVWPASFKYGQAVESENSDLKLSPLLCCHHQEEQTGKHHFISDFGQQSCHDD